ncbi:MAG: hypothetical protein U1E05_11505 [Patescibacteria group bacterium]|nr:hypothetical protein [Patescibacteria group bacterium]
MDKVKVALDLLRKYHFWVLCCVAMVIAVLCWTWATADLASQFETRKGTLNNQFDSLRQIMANPNLRNERSVETTTLEHVKQKEHVLSGWKTLYQQQKDNNPLPAVLGEDFRLHFDALQPGQEMRDRFRERYLNFIGRHYPALLRLVDLYRPGDVPLERYTEELRGVGTGIGPRPTRAAGGFVGEMNPGRGPAGARATRPGEAPAEAEPWVGLVEWPQPEVFEITAGWEQTPTTQQVLLAQEELWVYEALLRIIRNVNEGAESHDKAWIKRIDALAIGYPAAAAWVSQQQPIFSEPIVAAESAGADPMAGGAQMEGGMMGEGGTMPGTGMGGMGMGMGGRGAMADGMGSGRGRQGVANLLDGRYVDEQGMPLSAMQFETQPPYAEFRMMMVHMNLFMHQRRLPKLLVECANSAMPIQVVRVRINPGKGGSGTLDSIGGQGKSGGKSKGIYGEGGMGGGGGSRGAPATADEEHDYANIEVFGIIYIYNPPDLAKLGTGAAATERGEDVAPADPDAQPTATTPATPGPGAAAPAAAPAAQPQPAPAAPVPAEPVPAEPAPAEPAPAQPAVPTPSPAPASAAGEPNA